MLGILLNLKNQYLQKISFRPQRGALLTEMVLGMGIISLSVLFIANLPNSISLNSRSYHTGLARDIANQQIEYLRKRSFDNLVNTQSPQVFSDLELGKLPDGAGVFEIESCTTLCPNGEELKQLTVSINWREREVTESVVLQTMVAKGGVAR